MNADLESLDTMRFYPLTGAASPKVLQAAIAVRPWVQKQPLFPTRRIPTSGEKRSLNNRGMSWTVLSQSSGMGGERSHG